VCVCRFGALWSTYVHGGVSSDKLVYGVCVCVCVRRFGALWSTYVHGGVSGGKLVQGVCVCVRVCVVLVHCGRPMCMGV